MSLVRALAKRYVFNFKRMVRGVARRVADPLPPLPATVNVSNDALAAARIIRGENHRPAIMVHGVLQRSGTRYIGQLLKLHPDLCVYPRAMVELPFLNSAPELRIVQARFLAAFPPNRSGIGADDFLPLFGASFIAYIYDAVPTGNTAVFGMPDVSNLAYFVYMFPFELPLLLLRDGRDLVDSMVSTSPAVPFADACSRWNRGARIMLEQHKLHLDWRIFRYEDAVHDPRRFIEEVCAYCRIDAGRFPFDQIAHVPVIGSSQLKRDGEVSWDPVAKPAGFEPIGRWRRWTPRQKTIFKRVCGQTLLDTGYATNLEW